MEIDFKAIKKGIETRNKEITKSRLEISSLLILNADLVAVVDPAAQDEGISIMNQINTLKQQNERDIAFMDFAKAEFQKHNIPIIEIVDLGSLLGNLEHSKNYAIQALKTRFVSESIPAADFEEQLVSIKAPIDTRIAEITEVEAMLQTERGNA